MANIVLNGDMTTGHAGFPPTAAHASSGVTINGVAIVVEGDMYDSHTNVITHVNPTVIGNSNVTINGKKVILAGASLTCGDTATASSSVGIT